MRAATAALVLTIALLGCTTTPTAPPAAAQVTCGVGTHDNGAGVCVIDNALVLNNLAGLNYWNCPLSGSRGFEYKLSVSSSGPTSGSGVFWETGRLVDTNLDAHPHASFTWQEGPGTSAMTVSANPYFDTLVNIVPSSLTGVQGFSATGVKSGVAVLSLSCNLALGSF